MNLNIDEQDVEMAEESRSQKSLKIEDYLIGTKSGKLPSAAKHCIVCRATRVAYSGMRCRKCARETGLPTDPEGRLKRNNARNNPINNMKL
jgi:hypothetical protein